MATNKETKTTIDELAKAYPKGVITQKEAATAIDIIERVSSRIGSSNRTYESDTIEYLTAMGLSNTKEGESVLKIAKDKDEKAKQVVLGNNPRASNSIKNNLNGAANFLKRIV